MEISQIDSPILSGSMDIVQQDRVRDPEHQMQVEKAQDNQFETRMTMTIQDAATTPQDHPADAHYDTDIAKSMMSVYQGGLGAVIDGRY